MGLPMPNCTQETANHKIEFGRLGRRVVEGQFDGGACDEPVTLTFTQLPAHGPRVDTNTARNPSRGGAVASWDGQNRLQVRSCTSNPGSCPWQRGKPQFWTTLEKSVKYMRPRPTADHFKGLVPPLWAPPLCPKRGDFIAQNPQLGSTWKWYPKWYPRRPVARTC